MELTFVGFIIGHLWTTLNGLAGSLFILSFLSYFLKLSLILSNL